MLAPQKESIFGRSCRLWLLSWRRARVFARSCSLLSKYLPISWKQRKEQHMLSATSHIGLEFLTKFLKMSKLQNRLILLYQSLPLQIMYPIIGDLLIDSISVTGKQSIGLQIITFNDLASLKKILALKKTVINLKTAASIHCLKCLF